MKTIKTLIAICLTCGLLMNSGCQKNSTAQSEGIDQDAVNKKIVTTYSDLAIQNAIIAQHTLYPYHFVNNSDTLNPLGSRDLSVLIKHFQENPGRLIVRKGTEDNALYQARTQAVHKKLIDANIPQDKIEITDGMPGGDGMSSCTVIEILEKTKEAPSSDQSSGTGMTYTR